MCCKQFPIPTGRDGFSRTKRKGTERKEVTRGIQPLAHGNLGDKQKEASLRPPHQKAPAHHPHLLCPKRDQGSGFGNLFPVTEKPTGPEGLVYKKQQTTRKITLLPVYSNQRTPAKPTAFGGLGGPGGGRKWAGGTRAPSNRTHYLPGALVFLMVTLEHSRQNYPKGGQNTQEVKQSPLHACATPTLSNPVGCSPPGSPVHGISQARILEWVAISFPGALPGPGIKPMLPAWPADSSPLSHLGRPNMLSNEVNMKAVPRGSLSWLTPLSPSPPQGHNF